VFCWYILQVSTFFIVQCPSVLPKQPPWPLCISIYAECRLTAGKMIIPHGNPFNPLNMHRRECIKLIEITWSDCINEMARSINICSTFTQGWGLKWGSLIYFTLFCLSLSSKLVSKKTLVTNIPPHDWWYFYHNWDLCATYGQQENKRKALNRSFDWVNPRVFIHDNVQGLTYDMELIHSLYMGCKPFCIIPPCDLFQTWHPYHYGEGGGLDACFAPPLSLSRHPLIVRPVACALSKITM